MNNTTHSTWFYRILGEEFGPVTEQSLREMVRASQLAMDEEVRPADSDDWMTVASFEANYPESASADDLDSMLTVHEEVPSEQEVYELPEIVSETRAPGLTESQPPQPAPPVLLQTFQYAPPSGASRWYCRVAGKNLGPFDLPKLTRMVDAGELSPTDRVQLEGDTRWLTADTIDGLFSGIPSLSPTARAGHLSSQRLFAPQFPTSVVHPEDGVAEVDADSDFELRLVSPAAKKPSAGPKKRGNKNQAKSKISQDDIVDILSEPETGEETGQHAERPARKSSASISMPAPAAASYPASPAAGIAAPAAYQAPAYVPPPAPRFSPPPPPPRASNSSTSSTSLDFNEIIQGPAGKVVIGLLVAGLLWFGWSTFGGTLITKGDKYYFEVTEGVYLALKNADPGEFKTVGEQLKPLLDEVDRATKGSSDPKKQALQKCVSELLPRAIAGTARESKTNLEPVEKALQEAKL